MELLAKRQRPVLLRRSVLRCTRSTSGASFLQDALQRHGMEFRLFRRYLFDTRRIDRRIRLRHPEEVHIVILFVHVAILLIYRGKKTYITKRIRIDETQLLHVWFIYETQIVLSLYTIKKIKRLWCHLSKLEKFK